MTYVEKMVVRFMEEVAYNYGNSEKAAKVVQQIIADTKAACLESIKPFSRFAHMHHSAYVEAIEGAKIKEQEK